MTDYPIRSLIIIFALVFVNAIISAAEAAFASLNEANLKAAADEDDKKAAALLKLFENEFAGKAKVSIFNVIEFLLIATNLTIGFLLAKYQIPKLIELFSRALDRSESDFAVHALLLLTIVILVYIIVVFGVIFPKKLAIKNAENKAYFFGRLIKLVQYLLYPLLWLADKNTSLLLWIFGVKPEEIEENVTEEEIISLVDEGRESGVLEDSEAEMISNIIEFDEKVVRDIMSHRTKVVAISDETSMEEALHFMLDENYSRFPLYHENMDDIIGILHIRDVMTCHLSPALSNKSLKEIATTPYFVPDTRNIDALLHDMQNNKVHMAVVIDEYGQTAGIITLEDILEEIVGEIQDEYDDETESIFDQGDDAFLVGGETSLEDIEEEIGISFSDEEHENYDTLNGLLISILGRIPEDDEKEIIELHGYKFEIQDAHDKMLHLVRISKLEEEKSEEQ